MPSAEVFRQRSTSSEGDLADDNGKFLWSNILKEVTHKASFKLPDTRTLIVLGDDESGKTTLIARLQGTEDPKKSFGLEYTFIDVKDEDRDDQTKLNVWILDGGITHSRLLKLAMNENNLGECVVLIVVSMAEPWNIMDSLQRWADLLEQHIKGLPVPLETLAEYRNGLLHQFKQYVEPDGSLQPPSTPVVVSHAPLPTAHMNTRRNPAHALHPAMAAMLSSTLAGSVQKTVTEPEPTEVVVPDEIPLDEITLSENLGIPIIVVVTKTDTMNMLEKEERFIEEHFDFIQMHIRRFCLKYGAALFYLSVKEDKHCDLLNRYLQSRIYGFPFTQSPYVVERDCVFVPTGWDSEKKIAILKENFTQVRADDPYNEVIRHPPPRKTAGNEPELVAPDEQAFLTRLMTSLQRDISASAANNADGTLDQGANQSPGNQAQRPMTGQSPRTPPTNLRSKPSPPVSGSGSAGSVGAPSSRASEGVLANFFTSLLNRHSNVGGGGAPAGASGAPSPAQGADKLGMSPKDIQSELERLARTSREALEANNKSTKSRSSVTSSIEPDSPAEATNATEPQAPEKKTSVTNDATSAGPEQPADSVGETTTSATESPATGDDSAN